MKLKLFHIILFLLPAIAMKAQISYTLTIYPASCNTTHDGGAWVNVTSSNPPYTYLWNFGATTAAYREIPPGNYTVAVMDAAGNDTLIEVKITSHGGLCDIAPEQVLTPNGDGYNDTWTIGKMERYPESKVMIFNRWGQKVFEHAGVYQPWDGTDLLGIPAPDGAYYYIIYKDQRDEGTIVKGSVSIIR